MPFAYLSPLIRAFENWTIMAIAFDFVIIWTHPFMQSLLKLKIHFLFIGGGLWA